MAILFFARDPGPANQLVAVHELLSHGPDGDVAAAARDFCRLAQNDMPAKIFANGPAQEVWQRAGITATGLEQNPGASDAETIEQLADFLSKESAGRVITGAGDIDDDSERLLWMAARKKSIPAHAFIDHPANLRQRFRLRDGAKVFPDFVHAPQENYIPELVAAGVARESISITGPLHLYRLRRIAASDNSREAIRSGWGAGKETAVILFASECASEMAASGRPAPYNEFEMLNSLTGTVVSGGPVGPLSVSPERAVIVVRPHPRDLPGKYDRWLAASNGQPRRIVSADGSPEQAILASDIVVGMDSSLLREALALQKPALSLTDANLEL